MGEEELYKNQLDTLREELNTIRQVMEERHKLYNERAKHQEVAVNLALAGVEKQTALALQSQKEAANKLESTQSTYNTTHNDLLRRMDKQYEEMISRREHSVFQETIRLEASNMRKDLQTEIDSLKAEQLRQEGSTDTKKLHSDNVKWVIGLTVMILAALIYHLLTH